MTKTMTNEELLSGLENKFHPLGEGRGVALDDIQILRGIAHRCLDSPSKRSALESIERKLRRAGEALRDLDSPYLEEYGGIGLPLLREADKTLQLIKLLPDSGAGRPVRTDKLEFIVNCDRVIRHFFQVIIPIPDGKSLSTAPPMIHRASIDFSKSLWESEGLDTTVLRTWMDVVSDAGFEIFSSRKRSKPSSSKSR